MKLLHLLSIILHFITIMDDDINEAGKQFFIVALEIVDAINMELIARGHTHNPASITCTILDNDGKTGFDNIGHTLTCIQGEVISSLSRLPYLLVHITLEDTIAF